MRKPRPRDLHASERQETSHCFTSAVKPIPGDHHNRPSLTFLDLWQSNESIRKGLLNMRGGIKKTIPKNPYQKIFRFFDQKQSFFDHFLIKGGMSWPIQKILIRKKLRWSKKGEEGGS